MRRAWPLALMALLHLTAANAKAPGVEVAEAKPKPTLPSGVTIRPRTAGFYYADARGMTLYVLNQRIAYSRSGGIRPYCTGPCTAIWHEFAAPTDAKPIGDWAIVTGHSGPQWAYKAGPVFTFAADRAPGDAGGDHYEDLWDVIAHIPPAPALIAPAAVLPVYRDGRYILADGNGRALFVAETSAPCGLACADWRPLAAGLAARGVGAWAVARDTEGAHWTYQGAPVFVSADDTPSSVPARAKLLQP